MTSPQQASPRRSLQSGPARSRTSCLDPRLQFLGVSGFVLFSFALALGFGPAHAQDAKEGAALYRSYCATCHGIDGMGDGPMAGVLVIKPGDLTLLQTDSGGVFPAERVARRIDGRDPLVSHGSPMPVYGPFFEGEDVPYRLPSGQTMLTSRPIVDLLAYLASLQNI